MPYMSPYRAHTALAGAALSTERVTKHWDSPRSLTVGPLQTLSTECDRQRNVCTNHDGSGRGEVSAPIPLLGVAGRDQVELVGAGRQTDVEIAASVGQPAGDPGAATTPSAGRSYEDPGVGDSRPAGIAN